MNIRNPGKNPICFDVMVNGERMPVRLGPGASFDPIRYLEALAAMDDDGYGQTDPDPSREVNGPGPQPSLLDDGDTNEHD